MIIARDKDNFYCYNGNNKQSWFTSDKLVKITIQQLLTLFIKTKNNYLFFQYVIIKSFVLTKSQEMNKLKV